VGKPHLHLLTLAPRLLEGFRIGQRRGLFLVLHLRDHGGAYSNG